MPNIHHIHLPPAKNRTIRIGLLLTSQVHQPLRTEEKRGPSHSDRADDGGPLLTVFCWWGRIFENDRKIVHQFFLGDVRCQFFSFGRGKVVVPGHSFLNEEVYHLMFESCQVATTKDVACHHYPF